ncbi:3-oxoacyl-ACP reductase [Bacillus subtilis]|nr:SDR family NAD(P)-dependent oxidoreductase [Bacillus subtilis]OEI76310.1 3-oxoacyl-ACP reductase [Bacillus subtilis]
MMKKKNIMITGANSGIGFSAVKQFLTEGFRVVGVDIQTNKMSEFIVNSEFHMEKADLSDVQQAESLMPKLEQSRLIPDILINAAGIREITPVLELSAESFKKVIDINLTAAFILSRDAAGLWSKLGKRGCIINIASVSGLMAEPARAAYVSSKHAVIGLTKQLAMEFGSKGIRVNSISPGVIQTELTEEYFQDDEMVQLIKDNHALHTWGQPSDIVSCMKYLASDEAHFITGSNFVIDGGWTAGKKL